MNFAPEIPTPLRCKIAGWNLPTSIEITLFEALQSSIAKCDSTEWPTVHCFEFSANDGKCSHGFYVHYVARTGRDRVAAIDIDIDRITNCEADDCGG